MGIIFRELMRADLERYIPEYNKDGTEKHISLDGARFHVLSWSTQGTHCSESNCEMNVEDEEIVRLLNEEKNT